MLGAMRLRPLLVAVATSLLLAACGGSARRSGSATTRATTSSATTTVGATPSSSTVVVTTTTTASAPPEVPKATRPKKHRAGSPAASQGAHIEVPLTIVASGGLSPPTVSVPSGVGIELRLTNRGSAARTIALRVPGRPTVHLQPGAAGTLQAAGQRAGTYSILVDGTPRGQLMSGAQGGP
jgi:hypothetical protein